MSRYEETHGLVNSHIGARRYRSLNNEYNTLLRIEQVLENIALNLAELNDRLEKREDGLNVNTTIQA